MRPCMAGGCLPFKRQVRSCSRTVRMAAPDDGGDAPKSTIQVLSPASQLAETTVIVFFKNNVFLLVNLNVQFPPGNDINVPSCGCLCNG